MNKDGTVEYQYRFNIKIRENGTLDITAWDTDDIVVAHDLNEAIKILDEQNDRLGYKVLSADLLIHWEIDE